MKKIIYIQPSVELTKIQYSQTLCMSDKIGPDFEGGDDEDNPMIIGG